MSASTSSGGGNASGSGGNNTGGSSSGGGGGSPCGACKFLRRKCVPGCIFAPYFDSDQGTSFFASVHKVFGASNVSKLLSSIPPHKRLDAVITICYEAQSRLRDPVYGCISHICALQQQVGSLQAELTSLQNHLNTLQIPQPPPPNPPFVPPAVFSIADLPTVLAVAPAPPPMPATFDASALFDQSVAQNFWAMHQRAMMEQQRQYMAAPGPIGPTAGGGVNIQPVARETMDRNVPPQAPPQQASCSNASSSSSPSLGSK